jgi:hypothetical protein
MSTRDIALLSVVLIACNAIGPRPTPPITSAQLDADGDVGDVPDIETGLQTRVFFTCEVDTDCVPVAKNTCCEDGFKEAVNRASVDAYKASFTCPTNQPCATFRVVDTRVAHCARDTHKCELVRPDGGSELPTPR